MNPLKRFGQLHARIERLLVPAIVCLLTAVVVVYLLKIVWLQ
jgi:hypothetical protein